VSEAAQIVWRQPENAVASASISSALMLLHSRHPASIGEAEFPIFIRLIDALKKALALLVFRTEWVRTPNHDAFFGRTERHCSRSSGTAQATLSLGDVARGESHAF